MLLKVRAKNIDAMNRFIVDYLRELPEVDKTLTMFAMDSYLDTLELRGIEKVMEKIKKGKPKLKG